MVRDDAGFYRHATKEQIAEHEAYAQQQMLTRQAVNAKRAERLEAARASRMRKTEGRGDDFEWDEPIDTAEALSSHFDFPSQGQVKGLVVLVEYQDVKFTVENPLQEYSDMMMKPGYDYSYSTGKNTYKHNGSAHDYFYQNSMGKFDPQFDVYGPLLLKNDRAYYGSNRGGASDIRPHEMIIEACQQLDSLGIDFSQYDANGDGFIDFVFAFYAGPGENNTGTSSDAVWPHAWWMSSAGVGGKYVFDDKVLESYACTCEIYAGELDGVGTFCHEFSHVLGLPDLYDVNYKANAPYNYSVLDNGCYLRRGYHPLGYSAYERYELGWLAPTQLPDTANTIELTDFGTNNQAYIQCVTPDSVAADTRDGEYYLFENRQNIGWDRYMPGHGMMVWHIDYVTSKWWYNSVNTWVNHQCVDLVEADGEKANQNGSETFPGSANHTEFTDDSKPAFCGWTKPGTSSSSLTNHLGKPITNIQELRDEEAGYYILSFDLMGGKSKAPDNEEGITEIEQDAAQSASGLILLNGRTILSTATGYYDVMGRKIK